MIVRRESKLAPAFDAQRAQERPKQCHRRDEKSAMKKFLEIVPGEEWQDVARGQPLRGPKQNRREQRADEQRCGEVGEQSRCVFQNDDPWNGRQRSPFATNNNCVNAYHFAVC